MKFKILIWTELYFLCISVINLLSLFQDMLEHAIISVQTGRNLSEIPGMTLNQFPYPCYIRYFRKYFSILQPIFAFRFSINFIEKNCIVKCFSDRFIRSIAGSFPMFMTMSWIFGSAILVKSIVYEKEQRLKETMKVIINVYNYQIYFTIEAKPIWNR